MSRDKIYTFVFSASLLGIAGSLPYSIPINNVFIIILGINWLISGNLKYKLQRFYENSYALLFSCVYVCYMISLLYSQNLQIGLGTLENKLALFVFPLILPAYTLSKKLLEKVLLVFVISCLVAAVISTINAINITVKQNEITRYFYREALVAYFNYHPTYLSIYLLFCIVIIGYFLISYQAILKMYQKVSAIVIIIYMLGVCALLSARMPFIAFSMTSAFFLYYTLYKKQKFGWMLIITVSLILFLFSIYQIPAINERFVEITYTPLEPPVGINHNSTNIRVGILYCCWDILKKNWLLGLGTGDMQKALNKCYQENGFSEVLYKNSYDPHSQFLEIWLTVGIIGLFILLLNFFLPIKLAWQHNYRLYLFFLVLIVLCCFTESLLSLQKGVVFYSFFNSLFAFFLLEQKKANYMV